MNNQQYRNTQNQRVISSQEYNQLSEEERRQFEPWNESQQTSSTSSNTQGERSGSSSGGSSKKGDSGRTV